MAEFVKNYQTLIVGVLGFIGVMATLVLNAWLARQAEQRRIIHETQVLRTALVEEMKVQRDALLHGTEVSKKVNDSSNAEKKQDALTPLRRWTDIFDSSLSKLGLLTPEEVAVVLDAYLPLRELTSKIRLLELRVPPDQRKVEYGEAPEGYALVGNRDVTVWPSCIRSTSPPLIRQFKF